MININCDMITFEWEWSFLHYIFAFSWEELSGKDICWGLDQQCVGQVIINVLWVYMYTFYHYQINCTSSHLDIAIGHIAIHWSALINTCWDSVISTNGQQKMVCCHSDIHVPTTSENTCPDTHLPCVQQVITIETKVRHAFSAELRPKRLLQHPAHNTRCCPPGCLATQHKELGSTRM